MSGLVALLSSCSSEQGQRIVDKYFIPERRVQEVEYLFFPPFVLEFPTGIESVKPKKYKLKLERTDKLITPRGIVPFTEDKHKEVSGDTYNSINMGDFYNL